MSLAIKKYFVIVFVTTIILVLAFVSVFAQETYSIVPINENPEKILQKVDIRGITRNGFNFWQDKFTGHWAGVDFGFNTFLNKDYTGYDSDFMDNDILRSNSIYVNVIQQSIGLQHNRNTIGLVTGLGVHFQNYWLNQNVTIERTANDIIVQKELTNHENQKSKLAIFSITLPVLAEFQIPINNYKNRLYLSTGLFMSYRLGSHTKIKYKTDTKEKLKVRDHYSLHNFKYGLMFRAGYRWINVFASYEFTPLFKDGKGPELTPFTFGFTLLQF